MGSVKLVSIKVPYLSMTLNMLVLNASTHVTCASPSLHMVHTEQCPSIRRVGIRIGMAKALNEIKAICGEGGGIVTRRRGRDEAGSAL